MIEFLNLFKILMFIDNNLPLKKNLKYYNNHWTGIQDIIKFINFDWLAQ